MNPERFPLLPPEGYTRLTFEQTLDLIRPLASHNDPLPGKVEVAIIGAGPAGLTAAMLLGHYGIRTAVIERNAQISALPKAIVVDDEYMRLLHRLGLGEALSGHTSAPFGVHFMSPLGFAIIKVPGFVTANGFGVRNAVSQPVFERILLKGVEKHSSVSIHFDIGAVDFDQTPERARIFVKDTENHTHIIEAAYVLACDGARSFVRQHLDIPFLGSSLDAPHLVVDLAEFPDQATHSRFICNPRRPLNSVLGPYGGRRLEFHLLPDDDHEDIITDAGIQRLVDLHTPYKGFELKIIRKAIYGLAERIADRLRDRRIFLLGDAAHIMPPFGAQGMNTGARDAANLAWKLAHVLRGKLAETSLNSYDPERRAQIRDIVEYSVRVGKIANIRSWPLAIARDIAFAIANLIPAVRRYFSQMRYMPKPFIREGLIIPGEHGKQSSAGRVLPRWELSGANGRMCSVDDFSRLGWLLIGIETDAASVRAAAQTAPWATLEAGTLSITQTGATGFDARLISTRGKDDFDRMKGSIIALRPDNIIALQCPAAQFEALSNRYAELLKA